ncbi:hypothetical protein EPN81_02110 [Patescibacteria group bacterium]|nr:MAG: hypothetical protein EPN81_02110 [Patescibacteria group bacterium]
MMAKGFSLIETVLYIGLLAILVPSFTFVTLGYLEKSESIGLRIRMEERVAIILSEFQQELGQAQAIDITNSSLGSNDSSMVLIDSSGTPVTFGLAQDTVTFVGGDQLINRLQRHTDLTDDWMTDADMSVEIWRVDAVRNDEGVLTGLNLLITVRMLNPDGSPYRESELTTDTTFSLQSPTTELYHPSLIYTKTVFHEILFS